MKAGVETAKEEVRRSSSSSSETLSHLHSPPSFHSPLRSEFPDASPYASPVGSPGSLPPLNSDAPSFEIPENAAPTVFPEKTLPMSQEKPSLEKVESQEKLSQVNYSKAIVAVTQFSSMETPAEHSVQKVEDKPPRRKIVVNRATKEDGPGSNTRKVPASSVGGILRRTRREELLKIAALGLRISELALSLISFSVMAADRTEGWSGDSFDRYKEYRFCLSANVIAFAYSGFQSSDLAYYFVKEKHLFSHHLRPHLEFFIDQVLAYLLVSASSAAATRVVDWQTNWGKDKFTEMASASVSMAFLTFLAFAFSALISGYRLCTLHAL